MAKKHPVNLGSVIRTIRLRKGLTMKEVAEKMNVRETTIRKYEMNELIPKTSTRMALAESLGVDPAILLGDWTPEAASAIGHLISYFEMFGGSFIEKDGRTAIEFSNLTPFINAWADTYAQITREYEAASSTNEKAAVLDGYFDFLAGGFSTDDVTVTLNPSPNVPSIYKAVQQTMDNPPHLRRRKDSSISK